MEEQTSKEFAEAIDAALEAVSSGRVFEADAERVVHKLIGGGIEKTERVVVTFRGPGA